MIFFADWSEPAKQAAGEFRRLSESHPSVLFVSVDADKFSELQQSVGCESVPTVALFKGEDKVFLKHVAETSKVVELLLSSLGTTAVSPQEPKAVPAAPRRAPEVAINKEQLAHLHAEEKPQWSTVVSDGVLAAICIDQGRKLLARNQPLAAFAILLIGTAASCGTIRFTGFKPIRPLHTWLSAAVRTTDCFLSLITRLQI